MRPRLAARRPAMYVKRVTLKNVKCFSDFTLEFPDPPAEGNQGGWYVIVGPNGMGKSTILRAIALTTLVLSCINPLYMLYWRYAMGSDADSPNGRRPWDVGVLGSGFVD
jgi:hypothetical protein